MATIESTFWFKVLKARFYPSESIEGNRDADELLERLGQAVNGFRSAWMANYGRFWGADAWGVGYGGLDGLEEV